MGFNSALKC